MLELAELEDLKHFSKLSAEDKARVLNGKSRFSIVGFDIEATALKPNVGRILCCSFKPLGKSIYTLSALDKSFHKPDVYDDSALAAAIRDELEKFDIICGWNSRAFDIKFINARCLRAGKRIKRAQYHIDGMWAWRTKSAAWSGLQAVQQFIDPHGTTKSPILWESWMRALGWDKSLSQQSMDSIIKHCTRDVRVLENVYRIMVENDVVRSLRVDGGIF